MAFSQRTASIKIVLPFLVMMALVTLPTIGSAKAEKLVQAGSRFLSTDFGTHGRKLLQSFCGSGSAPDYSCKTILPFAVNATCCNNTNAVGRACYDVGILPDRCGSCNTMCTFGQSCCGGVCTNLLTDNTNCGICGNKCSANIPCQSGLCGYGLRL